MMSDPKGAPRLRDLKAKAFDEASAALLEAAVNTFLAARASGAGSEATLEALLPLAGSPFAALLLYAEG